MLFIVQKASCHTTLLLHTLHALYILHTLQEITRREAAAINLGRARILNIAVFQRARHTHSYCTHFTHCRKSLEEKQQAPTFLNPNPEPPGPEGLSGGAIAGIGRMIREC